jgi:ribosomal protein S18 acetylase RimI-like enzyme
VRDDRDVTVDLRRASEFPLRELAEIFTAAYEGYFVPFEIDEQTLRYMADVFDLLLPHSLVAVEDGEAVGLAVLGHRCERGWVGGVGVIPSRRGAGVGARLMRGLLDRARDLDVREVTLEVVAENLPAISVYEKLGFATTRDLEILSLSQADAAGKAREVDAGDAQQVISRYRDGPDPWQRDDATVANLARRYPPTRGLVSGDAAAVYRSDAGRVGLIQAAGDPGDLGVLVRALRRLGAVSAVNYPADGPVAAALRDAGAEVTLRQKEMTVAL